MRFIVFLLITIKFGGSCHSQSIEDSIVLVNVGDSDNGKIARLISEINLLNPKVVSLDIAFPEYTGNEDDKSLYLALRDIKKLVLPSEISFEGQDYYGKEMISVSLTCASEFFVPYAQAGFVSAEVAKDQIQIPKQFAVWQKASYSEYMYHHFSIVTARTYDSLRALSFIESHERLVDIDYSDGKRKFKTFSASEVLNGKLSKNDIEGKIVMMGFLGPGDHDKFFTPLNTNPDDPDMYGLQYLANIVAQVLEYNTN